jgi:hypothetical protein
VAEIGQPVKSARLSSSPLHATPSCLPPGCTLHVMVNAGTESEDRKVVTFSGVRMHGAAPNDIGVANLRAMGARFCEVTGYDELIVKGSDRTTGARPGRTAGHLRFKRHR